MFVFQISYSNLDEALKDEKNLGAIIHFPSNFSESFQDLLDNAGKADGGSFDNRIITAFISPLQVPFLISNKLYSTFQTFSENLMGDCEYPMKIARSP